MKKHYFILLFLIPFFCFSQITGKVIDENKNPIQGVSIYIENSDVGTISNIEGVFKLPAIKEGDKVIFKFLGYKIVEISYLEIKDKNPLEVVLIEEALTLDEVVVKSDENPAHRIIRMAQKNRKKNVKKTKTYTAEFYSKGIIKVKAPEKVLGQEVGNMGGVLDSTGQGIVYLSETTSKIFSKDNEFKEVISASKVSGNDNGFSFNNANGTEFNFYKNDVDILGTSLISPISTNAFSFYKYSLEGTFYTKENKLINKIKVTPTQKSNPVFEGVIYIVEDDWEFYGVGLSTTQITIQALNNLSLQQNFTYNNKEKQWIKTIQHIDFSAGGLGFEVNGRFSNVYSNYNLSPFFNKKTFGREIFSFEKEANKKDSTFWKKIRPLSLTKEESEDYKKKKILEEKRKDPAYLDSIDRKNNKFKWGDLLTGKTIRNSKKNYAITFSSLGSPPNGGYQFNTIQGHAINLGVSYNKEYKETNKDITLSTNFEYGLSNKILYPKLSFNYVGNYITYPTLNISMGKELIAFNPYAISEFNNTLFSSAFRQNFAKFYDKVYIHTNYSRNLFAGGKFYGKTSYEFRTPQQNNTDWSYFYRYSRDFTSNIPNNTYYDFEQHSIYKFNISFRYHFKERYVNYPDRRFTFSDSNLPILRSHLDGGISSLDKYTFYKIKLSAFDYNYTLPRGLGESRYGIIYQTFLQKNTPSFIDLFHFNGNKIIFNQQRLDGFDLAPYYEFSTSASNLAFHWEHNFLNGPFSNWPIIKQLNAHLNLGIHSLFIANKQPYQEFSIGLSKVGIKKVISFKIFYVRSYIGTTYSNDGIVFSVDSLFGIPL